MKLFFSCDWGTSQFRLRLINAETLAELGASKTGYGIAAFYNSWQQQNQPAAQRQAFYQSYILQQAKKLGATFAGSCEEATIIISGMASSSIGMVELPYKQLPFAVDGSNLVVHTIGPGQNNLHPMLVISGAGSETDAVRGEETILAGCDIATDDNEQLLILPGTHCKHIVVESGQVTNIATYITGELFGLLANKSILSNSVKQNDDAAGKYKNFFEQGVIKGASLNLLNSVFQVRTNQLFGKATPEENYYFLSGLLIGYELKDIAKSNAPAITLVCSDGLKAAYLQALSLLQHSKEIHFKDADEALIKGHSKILHKQVQA